MARVPGTFRTRIRDEAPTYPWGYGTDDQPADYSINLATHEEMAEAGFPDREKTAEFILRHVRGEPDPARVRWPVLRDPDGAIVATWDEGRWWTPYESARLIQDYIGGRESLFR